jgi:hypothetical protein
MEKALLQVFSKIGYCTKAPAFINSTATIESILGIVIPPRERFTEIHLSIKESKDLQRYIKF